MKPAKFPENNIVLGEDQKQYMDLPAHFDQKDPTGRMTTAWKLSFRERIRILFRGRIWLATLTWRDPFQPVYLSTEKPKLTPQTILKVTKPLNNK